MAEFQIYDEEILHTTVRPVETFFNKTQSISKKKGGGGGGGKKNDITDDIVTYWLNNVGNEFYWQNYDKMSLKLVLKGSINPHPVMSSDYMITWTANRASEAQDHECSVLNFWYS